VSVSRSWTLKVSDRGKQRRKVAVLTDTPEERAIKQEKKYKKATVEKRTTIKTKKEKIKRLETKRKLELSGSSSNECGWEC
jgi:hypothetical protein